MAQELISNTAEAIEFLKRWPAAYPHLTAIHVDPVTGEKGLIEARGFPSKPAVDWEAVASWIEERQGRANLYFSVNSLGRMLHKKAEKGDVAEIVALHVDIDVPAGEAQDSTAAALVERVQKHSPPPSAVIASGGGVQAFWILDKGSRPWVFEDINAIEAFEGYSRGLEDTFKADRCHNADRIMRLPGTVNLPDAKKREKGRVPALARLVEFSGAEHALSVFKAAIAPKWAEGIEHGKGSIKANVDVSWQAMRDIFRTEDVRLPGLRGRRVEEHALLSLEYGDNLKSLHDRHTAIGHRIVEGPYTSYSAITLAVASALLRAGLSPEEAAAVLTDDQYPGNKHVTKQKSDRDRQRATQRALTKAATDALANSARGRASAAGVPVWRECFDDHGLFPKPSLANAVIAVRALGVTCRLDLFRDRVVLEYRGERAEVKDVVGQLSDRALRSIRSIANNTFMFDAGERNILDAVQEIAGENAFNPIMDYLDGCVWDGVPRLGTWMVTYLQAKDTAFNRAVGVCMLVAAVRRARTPGCKFDTIAVLEGPEGTRKSGAIEALCGRDYFSDQTILGQSDKEAQELLQGIWHFECADLSGMSKAEVERTKAFASRVTDRARKAYGRVREEQNRQCVIWATTNDQQYLQSQTGNRRFWPVKCGRVDLEGVLRDRDQLWAEAVAREEAGESIVLAEDLWETAREVQEARRLPDAWEDTLSNIPDEVVLPAAPSTAVDARGVPILAPRRAVRIVHRMGGQERVASSDLFEHVLGIPVERQNTVTSKRLAVVMRLLGWTYGGAMRLKSRLARGYWRDDLSDPATAARQMVEYEADCGL